MPVDFAAAETFVWSAARLVDRHRYAMVFADGPAEPVATALAPYQNADGGFGHALEPDLRCPGSQPAATLYALEMLHEAGLMDTHMVRRARDWIATVAGPDGGIPFALPDFEPYPHSPWWEPGPPSSFLTIALAAALHAGKVTDDDWLARATDWSWAQIDAAAKPSAYWLKYACAFLDAVPDADRARAAIAALRSRTDSSTLVPGDGTEGEALRPLDLSPRPGTPSRELFTQAQIDAHLALVEEEQQEDGGWMFDWLAWSPAQTAAWRGVVTIRALVWLRDNRGSA
jgi:hypothetical protein